MRWMDRVAGRASHAWRRALAVLACTTFLVSIAAPGAASAATPYPGGKWEPGPTRYGTEVVSGVVPMDDGVNLAASIAYPTDLSTGQRAAGPFPVVIEYTPYVADQVNSYLAEHGYIAVVVHARGTGLSPGNVAMYAPQDNLDGKALVEWAARKLEGSDGRVALAGCSYRGGLALGTASAVGKDSPLKAVIAACIGLEGVVRQAWLLGGVPVAGFSYASTDPRQGRTPSTVALYQRAVRDVFAGGELAYEGEFWTQRSPMQQAADIVRNGVPVLLWTGYGDILDLPAVRTWVALQNAFAGRPLYAPMARSQSSTARYQIVVGNYNHAQGLDRGIFLQWLETWVRGVDTGMQKTKTPMHAYELGSERWINLAHYPAVQKYTPLYLQTDGALSAGIPANAAADSLKWGPPTQDGSRLTFTSAPLAQGATLAGPMAATLYASSSNTNLLVIAKLNDVAPDGATRQISKGVVLGSQHKLAEDKSWKDDDGRAVWPYPELVRDEYLTPGRVYRLDVSLAPRQFGVLPGHRLQLELITQNPTELCPALDSGRRVLSADPCYLTSPQQATVPGGTYTLHHGPQWPSAVNLPLLPANHFATARGGFTPTSGTRFSVPQDWGDDR
jgi:uncharacterized protein